MQDGTTETFGATDNPVVDDQQTAWTFGDAVEMRVPVTYEKITSDLENGWAQTRFKDIDNGKFIWGNFHQSQNARLFYSDGNSIRQLTDSLLYKDFVMANDGYAIWREDFTSLWLYDGTGAPVKIVDSLQCENMYVAGGSIGFHGFRVNSGSTVNQAWLYRIDSGTLTQLTHDSSQTVLNGITLVDGSSACWYRDDSIENMLMYYTGATTMRLSDSTIDSKFSYRNGIIVWSERRSGVMQIMMYNAASDAKTQITQGILDALSPITDGSKIVWFEGTGANAVMYYYDIASGATTRVAHYQPPIFRWLWLSNGKIAWSGNNEILVFDGNVISRLTNSGDFTPNTEPYVDNDILLWKQDSPIPSFPTYGDIFKSKLHAHVAFEAMNISGVAPLSVSFYNRSWQGVQTHSWDFGDGETSPEKHPVHTYQKPGTYTVTLTVTGLNGVVEERKIHLIRVTTPTSVSGASSEIPRSFALHQNYPNPFNPSTTIRFDVPMPSPITIKIYDILGREVTTLIDRKFEAGAHAATWDGKNSRELPVASGVYFIRMRAGEFVWVRKLALMR